MLRRYAADEVLAIEDVTPFVLEQRANIRKPDTLRVARETVYRPGVADAWRSVGLQTD